METVLLKTKNTLSELEEWLYARNVYVGQDRNIRSKIADYFDCYFKNGKVTKDEIEKLFLSVLAGKKRIQFGQIDGVFSSDLYTNVAIAFEVYVKHTKDDHGAYKRHCRFLQLLADKVSSYCKKYHTFSTGLGQFEQKMFCRFLASMINCMDLIHARKLYLLTWMCELMSNNFDLRWSYREFIIKIYSSVFPNVFEDKQRKSMLGTFKMFWE